VVGRLLVIGVDGLGWFNLHGELAQWMTFTRRLCQTRNCVKVRVKWGFSPRNWTLMFSGVDLPWYRKYVKPAGGDRWRLVRRDELPVRFIWDERPDIVVVNVPVVIPPLCLRTRFRPVAYGLPYTFYEWWREVNEVRRHSLTHLKRGENLIACFTVIDRMYHITAKRGTIQRISMELDEVIRQMVTLAERKGYHWMIVSDHGMRRMSEEEVGRVVPRHDMPYIRTVVKAIHEHEPHAIFISSFKWEVKSLHDVYRAIRHVLERLP